MSANMVSPSPQVIAFTPPDFRDWHLFNTCGLTAKTISLKSHSNLTQISLDLTRCLKDAPKAPFRPRVHTTDARATPRCTATRPHFFGSPRRARRRLATRWAKRRTRPRLQATALIVAAPPRNSQYTLRFRPPGTTMRAQCGKAAARALQVRKL